MNGKKVSENVREFNLKGNAKERRKQFRDLSKQHPDCEMTKSVSKTLKKKRIKTCIQVKKNEEVA